MKNIFGCCARRTAVVLERGHFWREKERKKENTAEQQAEKPLFCGICFW